MEEEKEESIQELSRLQAAVLRKGPVREVLEMILSIAQEPTSSIETVIQDVVETNQRRLGPSPTKYFAKLFSLLESELEELPENAYELFSSAQDTSGLHPVNAFLVSPDLDFLVQVQESQAFSEIGRTVWRASFPLVKFVVENKGFFRDKRVLELGSATGLGGMMAAWGVKMKELYLTDVGDFNLVNLRSNVKSSTGTSMVPCRISIYSPAPFADSEILSAAACRKVYCKELDFNKVRTSGFDAVPNECQSFDVIIGSDLVYDPELSELLTGALSILLKPPALSQGDEYHKPSAFLVSTLRNPATYLHFLQLCQLHGFGTRHFAGGKLQDPQTLFAKANKDELDAYGITQQGLSGMLDTVELPKASESYNVLGTNPPHTENQQRLLAVLNDIYLHRDDVQFLAIEVFANDT